MPRLSLKKLLREDLAKRLLYAAFFLFIVLFSFVWTGFGIWPPIVLILIAIVISGDKPKFLGLKVGFSSLTVFLGMLLVILQLSHQQRSTETQLLQQQAQFKALQEQQLKEFNFHKRPYLSVTPTSFAMEGPMLDADNTLMGGTFRLNLDIKNTGPIGAILENVEYIPYIRHNGKITGIHLSKINREFGIQEWENVPVLPGEKVSQEIQNTPFGKSDFETLGAGKLPVFMWIKLGYRAIGEMDHESMYYWVTFKMLPGSTHVTYISAGDHDHDMASILNLP